MKLTLKYKKYVVAYHGKDRLYSVTINITFLHVQYLLLQNFLLVEMVGTFLLSKQSTSSEERDKSLVKNFVVI